MQFLKFLGPSEKSYNLQSLIIIDHPVASQWQMFHHEGGGRHSFSLVPQRAPSCLQLHPKGNLKMPFIVFFYTPLVTGSLGQRFPRLLGHQTVAQLPAGSALCPHGPSSLLGICSGWKKWRSGFFNSLPNYQHIGALGLRKEVRFGGQQLAWDAKKALPGR